MTRASKSSSLAGAAKRGRRVGGNGAASTAANVHWAVLGIGIFIGLTTNRSRRRVARGHVRSIGGCDARWWAVGDSRGGSGHGIRDRASSAGSSHSRWRREFLECGSADPAGRDSTAPLDGADQTDGLIIPPLTRSPARRAQSDHVRGAQDPSVSSTASYHLLYEADSS